MKTCHHPLAQMRAAIGPESGVLCGLCGQDVPPVTVMQRAVQELRELRAEYEQAIDIVARHAGAVRCTSCRTVVGNENAFNGVRRQTLCLPCVERWFDNEEGDASDMNEGYLASYLLRMRYEDRTPRLLEMARQAFPGIDKRMMSIAR